MAGVTRKDKFGVVEWTIGNFSCWNENIHGAVIKSHEFIGVFGFTTLKLQLRPKGVGEHLLANIICDEPVALLGAFSIIGPDGSILGSSEPNGNCEFFNLSLVGPKFDEVASHIRKYEALHEDRLILKFRIRGEYSSMLVARTEIATIRASWKISSSMLKNLDSGFNFISRTYYPLDGSVGEMDLIVLKGDSDIQLRLDHESSFLKNVLIFVNVSVLGKDGAVLATEEKAHAFCEIDYWIFWNLPLTKGTKEFSFMLRVKIVPSEKYKHQIGYLVPTFDSRHWEVSLPAICLKTSDQ